MTRNYRVLSYGVAGAVALAFLIGSCGGTGGGGGTSHPDEQFVLNSSNSGRFLLNVDPTEVDANKSDRIGLVAQLSDSRGVPIRGVEITFSSDIPDLGFIPASATAITDANGRADIIAVAGATPTGTGAIVGTGAITAAPPAAFGLVAQVQVTLLDVGFIDADSFSVIPSSMKLVEPAPGAVTFFNLVGGTPPYRLTNEVSGVGAAVISQHCLPGCTENGGVLCVGSPCQSDGDCNQGGSPTPSGVCAGPISRCLASCAGTNCAGSRCETDADCNDGSPVPANVCKDSGQSIAYIVGAGGTSGTHTFTAEDSAGAAVTVTVEVSYICGNGVARGEEQCDLGDLRGATCASLGFSGGSLICSDSCKYDPSSCVAGTPGGPTPVNPTATPTPTGAVPTPTATGTPGAAANVTLAVLSFLGADNRNGTATTVVSATVSDANGNPVADGTTVSFGIVGATAGALITAQSLTGNLPPQCDVQNYQQATGIPVLQQHGVAHACVTYPISVCSQCCALREPAGVVCSTDFCTMCGGSCASCTITASATVPPVPPDTEVFTLPQLVEGGGAVPTPTVTATP